MTSGLPTKFVTQAADSGSIPAIPNPLVGGLGDDTILIDPVTIQAYTANIADQINSQRAKGIGPLVDLSDRIADVVIETSAQGASMLEVHINDPTWFIPWSGFIQVFDDGYLAPVDVHFPPDTKCVWRLCQYRANWDAESGDGGNLILTFEDKIAAELRSVGRSTPGAVQQGTSGESLMQFFKQLVDSANHLLGTNIVFTPLVDSQDPNTQNPTPPTPSRPNPGKTKQGPTAAQQQLANAADQALEQAMAAVAGQNALNLTLSAIETLFPQGGPATTAVGDGSAITGPGGIGPAAP